MDKFKLRSNIYSLKDLQSYVLNKALNSIHLTSLTASCAIFSPQRGYVWIDQTCAPKAII